MKRASGEARMTTTIDLENLFEGLWQMSREQTAHVDATVNNAVSHIRQSLLERIDEGIKNAARQAIIRATMAPAELRQNPSWPEPLAWQVADAVLEAGRSMAEEVQKYFQGIFIAELDHLYRFAVVMERITRFLESKTTVRRADHNANSAVDAAASDSLTEHILFMYRGLQEPASEDEPQTEYHLGFTACGSGALLAALRVPELCQIILQINVPTLPPSDAEANQKTGWQRLAMQTIEPYLQSNYQQRQQAIEAWLISMFTTIKAHLAATIESRRRSFLAV
jgi:hypothetical protein